MLGDNSLADLTLRLLIGGVKMSDEDCDAVAEFIRSRGITRCPTACVLPTQGLITAADRIALEPICGCAGPSAARASRCSLAILDADGLTGASLVWWLPVVPLMAAVHRPLFAFQQASGPSGRLSDAVMTSVESCPVKFPVAILPSQKRMPERRLSHADCAAGCVSKT